MTLRQFIKEHRQELKEGIERRLNYVPKEASCYCPKNHTEHYHTDDHRLNDEDLRQWIMSDEGLYRWARTEGVRI